MSPQKPTGLHRIIKAIRYSCAGIRAAFVHEPAFRQEMAALICLLPLGLFLGQNGVERAVLISPLVLVILTELVNSAIEAIVDRTGLEYHPLSERAKDLGSAAVFVSIGLAIIVWVLVLI